MHEARERGWPARLTEKGFTECRAPRGIDSESWHPMIVNDTDKEETKGKEDVGGLPILDVSASCILTINCTCTAYAYRRRHDILFRRQ